MGTHAVRDELLTLFQTLDARIEEIHRKRRREGLPHTPKAKVRLLGQISLLVQERVSAILTLTQTADMDAVLSMDHWIKEELKTLLKNYRYIYDEDSHLIWIPEGSKFMTFVSLANLVVECIDPESALVSKAIKAPEKNRHLIRQAIASGEFPALVDRILKHGGRLEEFI